MEKNPLSRNPAVADLTYGVADEKRDVAARLAAYQATEEQPGVRSMGLPDVLRQAQQTAREGRPVYVNAILGRTDFRKGSISM